VKVIPIDGLPEAEILHSAAIAEKYSEHPLGKAVVEAAKISFQSRVAGEHESTIEDPQTFEALPGLGIRANVHGKTVLLGKPQLFIDQNLDIPRTAREHMDGLTAAGHTIILSAMNEKVTGVLVFEDRIRPETQAMLQQVQAMGLRTVLLTGDQSQTAQRVAAQLGIQEVHAEVLPHQKVDVVRRIQQENQVVAFIGDGINDGPALAASDVGIAMGLSGTDLAIETAEITLLSDDLSKLPQLITLSKQAMQVIRQNLIFSLTVLALAVLLTITGVLTPVTGALLHELSSIPVIANSARLIGLKHAS
jgi:Cd2+/Zn2+-exporting ATPase